MIDVQKCSSDVCDYFVNIPVKGKYGGVNVPLNTHDEIPDDAEIGESKLYRKDDKSYINITIEYDVDPIEDYDGILGIGLGLLLQELLCRWQSPAKRSSSREIPSRRYRPDTRISDDNPRTVRSGKIESTTK